MDSPCSFKRSGLVGLTCFAFFLILYGATVCPTVGLGHDTGELTTCCVIQGVPHSPGYPLFAALGWLAAQLPIGQEPAYRINLLGALELSLGLGFLGSALSLTAGVFPGLVATLLVGLSSVVWRQAVVTEVFSLHLFFLCLLIWLAILWERAGAVRRREILIVTSFVLGCCLAHQHIIALAAPAFLLFGTLAKGKKQPWGFSPICLPVFLAALVLPYALQAYQASLKPAINWGDPETLKDMWDHFLRRSYGTGLLNEAALAYDARAGDGQVSAYFISMIRSYLPFPTCLLVLLGVDNAIRLGPSPRFWLFGGIFLAYGPIFAILGNQPGLEFYGDMMERFYSSSLLGLGGLAAIGLGWLSTQLDSSKQKYLPACLLLPLYSGILNFPKSSQAGQYQALDLVQAVYQCLPPKALLITNGDLPAGTANYLRLALGRERGVVSIMPGLAGADWYQESLPARMNLAGRIKPGEKLDHSLALNKMVATAINHGYTVWINEPTSELQGRCVQCGLVFRYFPNDAPSWSEQEYLAALDRSFKVMENFPRRGDYRLNWRQNFWLRYCIDKWVDGYYNLANGFDKVKPELALQALTRVVEMDDPLPPELFVARASLYARLNRLDEAIKDARTALDVAPDSRPIIEGLVTLLDRANRKDEADRYRRKLETL